MVKRILGLAMMAALALPLGAQTPTAGSSIMPVYEGFWRNADGTSDLLFGYFNRSWEDDVDVPIGAGNTLEPGGNDQGQPTHFFPRRNRFVFKIRVPADFDKKEVVWAVTVNGKTERAYGTLKPAYAVDENVMMANFGGAGLAGFREDMVGNKQPKLTIESQRTLTAKVGQPVTLTAVATDDGKLLTQPIPNFVLGESHFAPVAATGLRLTWFKYRGAGAIDFDPPQAKVWEDTRDGMSSPWAVGWKVPPVPPGNRWAVRATFREPGTYTLRAQAHDGGLADYGDVTVIVTR